MRTRSNIQVALSCADVVSERRVSEDRQLLERYHRTGDPAVRDELVARFLPLAEHLARRYGGGGPIEDVAQVASIGLLNAIERFDPARGTAFSSFATPTIIGEIKRYFRDKGWAVRVPRELQERSLIVEHLAQALAGELGRTPTLAEIGERAELPVESVLEARLAGSAHHGVSLELPVSDEEPGETLGDRLAMSEPGFARVEAAAGLASRLAELDERERRILQLRFEEDLTQRQIAKRVGISQMQVSRLLSRSIARLRDASDHSRARDSPPAGQPGAKCRPAG
jgi:RNA polymerase sigma-B factor